jgi:hypothetical protein
MDNRNFRQCESRQDKAARSIVGAVGQWVIGALGRAKAQWHVRCDATCCSQRLFRDIRGNPANPVAKVRLRRPVRTAQTVLAAVSAESERLILPIDRYRGADSEPHLWPSDNLPDYRRQPHQRLTKPSNATAPSVSSQFQSSGAVRTVLLGQFHRHSRGRSSPRTHGFVKGSSSASAVRAKRVGFALSTSLAPVSGASAWLPRRAGDSPSTQRWRVTATLSCPGSLGLGRV